jgi:hypothetical protein
MKHPDLNALPSSASACESTRVSQLEWDYDREYDNVHTSGTFFTCTVFALYVRLATERSILTRMRTLALRPYAKVCA